MAVEVGGVKVLKPMTEFYEKNIDLVRSALTPEAALQPFKFILAGPILLVGEEERLLETEDREKGYFTHHYFSVDGNLGLNNPRQLCCYDPCLMYHGRTNQALRLASGVSVSAFQMPGPQTVLLQTESYLECIMENSEEGIGQYNIQGHNGPLYFLNV